MSLEEYDKYLDSLEEIYNEEEGGASELIKPLTYPGQPYLRRVLLTLETTWDTIKPLIHKESFTPDDITKFLISYIRMIGASNGQVIPENPGMGFIDIENVGKNCYYLGNDFRDDIACKLEDVHKRLTDYVELLKRTFVIFFKQLHTKNPELIPLLKTMDYIEILHKAIQFLFYFAGSKLKGEMYTVFGFGSFISELQAVLPDTIEVSCTNHRYGWGRHIFFKSCKNKRTQGKVYIGCTAGIEFDSINGNSSNIEKGSGPICDEPAAAPAGNAAAVEVEAKAALPAGAASNKRKTRKRRNHRNGQKRRNRRTRRQY